MRKCKWCGKQAEKEVRENARCAIRGLVVIQETGVCEDAQNKAECYFTQYNDLDNTQSEHYISEFIRGFGSTEFGQIYETWDKEYTWRAS